MFLLQNILSSIGHLFCLMIATHSHTPHIYTHTIHTHTHHTSFTYTPHTPLSYTPHTHIIHTTHHTHFLISYKAQYGRGMTYTSSALPLSSDSGRRTITKAEYSSLGGRGSNVRTPTCRGRAWQATCLLRRGDSG